MVGTRKMLDDAAMLAGGVMNLVSAGREHVRREMRSRADSLADRLDLVPRGDFERLEALLIRSREEQEALKKRLDVIEKIVKSSPVPARSRKPS